MGFFFNMGFKNPKSQNVECLYRKCGDILSSTQRLVTHLETEHDIYRDDYFSKTEKIINEGKELEQAPFNKAACEKAIVLLVAAQKTTIRGACSNELQNLIYAVEGGTNLNTTKFKIPTDKTVRSLLHTYHMTHKKQIIETLSNFPSFGISVDGWAGNFNHPIFGIKVTYNDGDKLMSYAIGFEHLYRSHSGDYFAEVLFNILCKFGIEKRVLGLSSDNAPNNYKMVKRLSNLITDGLFEPNHRVPCAPHVYNVAVQAVFAVEFEGSSKKAPNVNSKLVQVHVNKEKELSQPFVDGATQGSSQFLLSATRTTNDEDIPELHPLMKIKGGLVKIFTSNFLTSESIKLCEELNVDERNWINDSVTRWSSTSDMIVRLLIKQEVFNLLMAKRIDPKKPNEPSKNMVYYMHEKDIAFITELNDLIKLFKIPTKILSSESTPTLCELLNQYYLIEAALLEKIKVNNPEHIKVLAWVAIKKIWKFRNESESNPLVYLATILDPRKNLKWFEGKNTNFEIAKDDPQLNHPSLKPKKNELPDNVDQVVKARRILNEKWLEFKEKNPDLRPHPAWDGHSEQDELEDYLATVPHDYAGIGESNFVLEFWSRYANSYPRLAAFARFYLPVLASSVSCERLFSFAKHFLSTLRNRTSSQLLKELVLTGDWNISERPTLKRKHFDLVE